MAASTRHLNRLFEPHGCTATQWICRTRLAAAQRLLASGHRAMAPVGEVALQCGFANPAHFARAFKQAYGVTPTEHRRTFARA
jgi:AraC family transcriptional regulator, positive regulator of tynA and feaB